VILRAGANYVKTLTGPVTAVLPAGQPLGTIITVQKADESDYAITVFGNVKGAYAGLPLLHQSSDALQFKAAADGSWWPVTNDPNQSATTTGPTAAFTPDTAHPGLYYLGA